MLVSENDEENENYAVQDNDILNTKEATAYFCTLYMNAGMIEFLSFEPVVLVKIKNVFAH